MLRQYAFTFVLLLLYWHHALARLSLGIAMSHDIMPITLHLRTQGTVPLYHLAIVIGRLWGQSAIP